MKPPPSDDVRTLETIGPTVAGSWYPSDQRALERILDAMLDAASRAEPSEPSVTGNVVALIAPHAGYSYSGEVAARGFHELIGRRFARVILLGPSHHAAFEGATLPSAHAYRTPLGDVPLDRAASDELADRPGMRTANGPFHPEHCLEMEIPFLQRVLYPGWRLLPLLIGGNSRRDPLDRVAEALAPWIDGETLIVVSSDFTHYGSGFGYVPFEDEVPDRIRRLDMGAVDHILTLDRAGFESYVDRTGATICGRNAIGVLLRLLPEDVRASLVAYDTSGRMTGDWRHTVSYASVAFTRPAA